MEVRNQKIPDFNQRLTNADVATLASWGFGPELSGIILRNLIQILGAHWNDNAPFRLADLFSPIDSVMIENGLYVRGDVVNVVGTIFVCLTTGTTADPTDDNGDWLALVIGRII